MRAGAQVCVAVSPDGSYFASLTRDPYRAITSLLVFHGLSLDPFMRIETDAEAYVKCVQDGDGEQGATREGRSEHGEKGRQ